MRKDFVCQGDYGLQHGFYLGGHLPYHHASQPVFEVMSRKERLQVPSFKLLVIMDDEFAAFQLQIAFADVGVNHA